MHHEMIFFPRGFPAPQVTLLLVDLKNILDLSVQRGIDVLECLCHIFMYRAFADTKLSGNRSDRCLVFYQVICQNHTSLLVGRRVRHTKTSHFSDL